MVESKKVKMWMPCPGVGCDSGNPKDTNTFLYWTHGDSCGASLSVYANGAQECDRGCPKYYLWDSVFRCHRHENYLKPDLGDLMIYAGVMVKITAERAGKEDYDFYKALSKTLNRKVLEDDM